MPDPIRTEDHNIGLDPTDPTTGMTMPWTDELNDWKMAALAEAIHQTFERDAERERLAGTHAADDITDPDTEIDRLARLIVDGEYRRRKESEDA